MKLFCVQMILKRDCEQHREETDWSNKIRDSAWKQLQKDFLLLPAQLAASGHESPLWVLQQQKH